MSQRARKLVPNADRVMRVVSFTVSDHLLFKLDALAVEEGRSRSSMIGRLIQLARAPKVVT